MKNHRETAEGLPAQNGAGCVEYVQMMGDFFAQLGLPATAGRLFGHLLVCEPAEQNAAELAEAVGASSGSVNTMLRLLVGLGLVTRKSRVGSRQYLYRIPPEAWADLLTDRLRLISRLRELAELGLRLVGDEPGRSDRLSGMRDFYAFFEREMGALIRRFLSQRGSRQ